MDQIESSVIKERVDDLYGYVHRSLNFAEGKNGALAALNSGIIISVLRLYTAGQNGELILGFLIPIIGSLVLVLLSFYPLNSSKEKKKSKAHTKNLFSCENISLLTLEALKIRVYEGQEMTFFENDKIENIYHVASTASRKYKLFRAALFTMSLAPIGLLIAYLFTL